MTWYKVVAYVFLAGAVALFVYLELNIYLR